MATGTETTYAMNGDIAIAYRMFGEGERDLLLVSNWFSSVEALPDVPHFTSWIDHVTQLGRLIMFDQPGTGASDPVTEDAFPTLEQWSDCVGAVMDAVNIERATLIAFDGAFAPASIFATTYPSRVDALVGLGAYGRARRTPDYPIGRTDEEIEAIIQLFEKLWGTGEVQHIINPDLPWNEGIRAAWGRAERLAASPAVVRRMLRLTLDIDVLDVLPLIRVPTLILEHVANPWLGKAGTYLAERIPGARCVNLPGANFYPVNDEAFAELREFLTGERGSPVDEERVLATVLFTDIVDSTTRAAQLGDRDWRALLDAHDAVVRAQLTRFRGNEVKTVGDGFLATFDGPQRAIKCALAIRDAVRPLGLELRAGLHTGECEIRGDDIGGIAVHIGARVSAIAGANEVLVSSTVKDLVVGSGLSFDNRGARELKGVPGTWNLYAVAS